MRGPLRFRHRPRVLIVGASALAVVLPLIAQVGVGGAPVAGPPLPLMVSMAAIDPTTLAVTSDLAKRLRTHVEYLAGPKLSGRKPGTPGNRAAADYIAARFGEAGLVALPSVGSYGQEISPAVGDNLIGLQPGTSPDAAAPWLLIGAHYDHLGGQYLGADDNASSVAILLGAWPLFTSSTGTKTVNRRTRVSGPSRARISGTAYGWRALRPNAL